MAVGEEVSSAEARIGRCERTGGRIAIVEHPGAVKTHRPGRAVRCDYLSTIERRLGEQDECEKHTDKAQWTGSPGQNQNLGE